MMTAAFGRMTPFPVSYTHLDVYKRQGVTLITEKSAISRPAVSHHLKLLLDAGLIDVRQEGRERIYKINLQNSLKHLKNLVSSIENDMK